MNASRGPAGAPGRGGALALVAVLAAAVAAAVFVYHERTPDLALEVVALDTTAVRGVDEPEVTFFVRFDEPDATIQIVGRSERPVRTLARDAELVAGERVACVWDGRRNGGRLAPPGAYRLRVVLPSEDREMIHPQEVELLPGRPPEEADGDAGPVPCPEAAR